MPFLFLLFTVFSIALIVFMPLAGLWALNTLFGLNIPYTGLTWLAAFILFTLVSGKEFISIKTSRS